MDDEAQPLSEKQIRELDLLSVDELHVRIASLKQEIIACEKAIAKKGNAKSAADAMFSFGNKND